MLTYCHCICLRLVSHTDTVSIATLYSREQGMMAAAVHLGKSAEARRRRAMLTPLSLVEAVSSPSRRGNLVTLSDIALSPGGASPGGAVRSIISAFLADFLCAVLREGQSDIHLFDFISEAVSSPSRRGNLVTLSDIALSPGGVSPGGAVRSIISAFLADFLCAVLREGQPDIHLFDFISDAVRSLSEATGTALANFHLYFLYRLGRYLGIEPDMATYGKGRYLDMREGTFCASPPSHRDYIDGESTSLIHALSRANMRSLGLIKLNRMQRNQILDAMLAYYTMHHTPVQRLTSLQIARDLLQ